MTQLLLIRHARHELIGRGLAGRTVDIGLDAEGRLQASRLAERLAHAGITELYTSPRRRTQETIAPLAAALQLSPRTHDGLDEIEFGDWSGRTFEELAPLDGWRTWCERRSEARAPGGESIGEAQSRALDAVSAIAREHHDATIALVSHADVIKSVLAAWLRMSLDDLERFDIAPASVSVARMSGDRVQVTRVNDTGDLRAPLL